MKKYIIVLFLVLCFCNLYAQEYEYVDSLESVQINIKADFDFEKRSMLIFSWGDALVDYKRNIYYNRNNDEYFYLLTIDLLSQGIPLRLHLESLSLPKITNSEKIKFDTIFNSNGFR